MLENLIKTGFGILMIALGIWIVIYMNKAKSTYPNHADKGYILGFGFIVIGIIHILKILNFL